MNLPTTQKNALLRTIPNLEKDLLKQIEKIGADITLIQIYQHLFTKEDFQHQMDSLLTAFISFQSYLTEFKSLVNSLNSRNRAPIRVEYNANNQMVISGLPTTSPFQSIMPAPARQRARSMPAIPYPERDFDEEEIDEMDDVAR